jgi:hypothetical protein
MIRLKCDRGHPCESCRRRGFSPSCTYVTSNTPSQIQKAQNHPKTTLNHLQDRAGQLEQLVTSLANKDSTNSISFDAEGSPQIESPAIFDQRPSALQLENLSQLPDQLGRISLSSIETTYVESSHWTAILGRVRILFNTLT